MGRWGDGKMGECGECGECGERGGIGECGECGECGERGGKISSPSSHTSHPSHTSHTSPTSCLPHAPYPMPHAQCLRMQQIFWYHNQSCAFSSDHIHFLMGRYAEFVVVTSCLPRISLVQDSPCFSRWNFC